MITRKLVNTRTLAVGVLVAAIGAIALVVSLAGQARPTSAGAADHLDAPGLTPPPGGDGIGTDLTDIYAFRSPANAGKTVLVMNVNGLMASDLANPPGADRPFGTQVPQVKGNPNVSYNFRVDSNGDAVADLTIQVRFVGQPKRDGAQQMLVKFLGAGGDDDLDFA